MDEKSIETKEEQPTEEKKAYTPPTLTVYGKLAELTGGGRSAHGEGAPGSLPTDKP